MEALKSGEIKIKEAALHRVEGLSPYQTLII